MKVIDLIFCDKYKLRQIYLFIAILLFSCSKVANDNKINEQNSQTVDGPDLTVQYDPELTGVLDQYFFNICRKRGFNGNLLVAKEGKIIYRNSHGIENLENHDSLSVQSIFQLASVSKQFTAAGIMMLKDEGLLTFDDSIQKFFPKFPYKGITIRQLLTHRSGLPNYMYFCDTYTDRETPVTNMDIVTMMEEKQPPAYTPPNKRFRYCNTGYGLLGAIIEKISEMPYEDFIEQRIFKPLGMKRSFVYNYAENQRIKIKGICQGYEIGWKPAENIYLEGVLGDKGIFSTVYDLFIWDQALYTNKIIKQETLKEALEPGSKELKGIRNYGFGWRMRKLSETHTVYYHGGWWRGYQSLFVRDIQNKITVIALSNKKSRNMPMILSELLGLLEIEKSEPNKVFLAKNNDSDSNQDDIYGDELGGNSLVDSIKTLEK